MIKATVQVGYLVRLGLVAGVCLLWAGWSLYDGMVRYPNQRQAAEAYQDHLQSNRLDRWPAYAQQHGWAEREPPPRSQLDIYVQYVMAGMTLPVGLFFAVWLLRMQGRWIGLDEQGLTTSWGQQVTWPRVTGLDRSRWEEKGIAVVRYTQGTLEGSLVLDDWRYDQVAIASMVNRVDQHLAGDQVKVVDKTADQVSDKAAD